MFKSRFSVKHNAHNYTSSSWYIVIKKKVVLQCRTSGIFFSRLQFSGMSKNNKLTIAFASLFFFHLPPPYLKLICPYNVPAVVRRVQDSRCVIPLKRRKYSSNDILTEQNNDKLLNFHMPVKGQERYPKHWWRGAAGQCEEDCLWKSAFTWMHNNRNQLY